MVPQGMGFECARSPPFLWESEPDRVRHRLEAGWNREVCGSRPPLSAAEGQPDRRAGTASKTDCTERCGDHVLGPPPSLSQGRAPGARQPHKLEPGGSIPYPATN